MATLYCAHVAVCRASAFAVITALLTCAACSGQHSAGEGGDSHADLDVDAKGNPDDDASGDSTPSDTVEAAPAPGAIGSPCQTDNDCDAPLCLDTPIGKRCSTWCGDGACPEGWRCEGHTEGADVTAFCAPAGGLFCRPCDDDGACRKGGQADARCVDYGDIGHFCGVACMNDDGCPKGGVCRVVTTVAGKATKQCVVPGDDAETKGLCACSVAATASALGSGCWRTTGEGPQQRRCKGHRACGAEGLGACVALKGDAALCLETQCLDPLTDQPIADGKPCDDGRICTQGDVCQGGLCASGTQTCPCEPGFKVCDVPAGASNACVGAPYCKAADAGTAPPYVCGVNPAEVKVCDASLDSDCVKNACVPLSGTCTATAVERTKELCDLPANPGSEQPGCRREALPAGAPDAQASPCDDGMPCSTGDHCEDGNCMPADATGCTCVKDADCADDGDLCNGAPYCSKGANTWICKVNPSTIKVCDTSGDTPCLPTVCDPVIGECKKVGAPLGKACDDGVACTKGDTCDGEGVCTSGSWTCCVKDADCVDLQSPFYADDGDKCNGVPFCDKQKGACVVNPATKVQCPTVEDTACHKTICAAKTGACVVVLAAAASKTACDDGDSCTSGETCDGFGACAPHVWTCPCQSDADCAAKDDGDLCNGVSFCDPSDGKCKPNPATVVSCKTVDDTACRPTLCQPKTGECKPVDLPAKTTCDADGSFCTSGDACDGLGGCIAGTAVCACVQDADCAGFEDGNPCNGTLYCDKSGGKTGAEGPVCRVNPKTVVSCPSVGDDACVKNLCQPASGECAMTKLPGGSPCQDGDVCTGGDFCNDFGGCVAGLGLACACSVTADCGKFDDGDACNGAYGCAGGGCVFAKGPPDCGDGNVCTDDGCEKSAGCVHLPNAVTCDDADACTVGEHCVGGGCSAAGAQALQCDDGNGCTTDGCDKGSGCVQVALADGVTCTDGSACTGVDICAGGVCKSGQPRLFDATFGGPKSDLGQAIVAIDGGGVAIAGRTKSAGAGNFDGWLVRVDAAGSEIWAQTYGGADEDAFYALRSTQGGLIAAGSTASSGAGGTDGWLVRLEASGKQAWQAHFGNAGDDRFNAIATVADGFALAGAFAAGSDGKADGWIVRTGIDGVQHWSRSYGGAGDDGFQALVTLPGGFAVAGYTASQGAGSDDFWLVRTNHSGIRIWERTYGGKGYDSCMTLLVTAKGFVLGGPRTADGANLRQPWLLETDLAGAELWSRGYGIADDSDVLQIAPAADGYVVVGHRSSSASGDGWMGKIDLAGNPTWSRTYGGGAYDNLAAMVALDAGFALTGVSKSKGAGDADAWLLRVDAFGNADCKGTGPCVTMPGDACDDGKACTADACDVEGGCLHAPLPDASPCDDGVVCTVAATCKSGTCQGGKPALWDAKLVKSTSSSALTSVARYDASHTVAVGWNDRPGAFDVLVTIVDDSGDVSWQKTLGSQFDEAAAVAVDHSGAILVAGSTHTAGEQNDGLVIKLHPEGKPEIAWLKSVASAADSNADSIYAVALDSDDSLSFAGVTQVKAKGNKSFPWFGRIGSDGDVKVNKVLTTAVTGEVRAIAAMPSGNYMLVGGTNFEAGHDGWCGRAQADGTLVASVALDRPGVVANALAIAPADDDTWLVVGDQYASTNAAATSWVAKVSSSCQPLWIRSLSLPAGAGAWNLMRQWSGRWLLAGASELALDDASKTQALLAAIDGDANVVWVNTNAGAGRWYASMALPSSGRLLVAGLGHMATTTARLAVVDAFGNLDCKVSGVCSDVPTGGCDDANSCTADACDAKQGCTHLTLADASTCDDGDACSADAACSAGSCKGGKPGFGLTLLGLGSPSAGFAHARATADGRLVAVGTQIAGTPAGGDGIFVVFGASGDASSVVNVGVPAVDDHLTSVVVAGDVAYAAGFRATSTGGKLDLRVAAVNLTTHKPVFATDHGFTGQDIGTSIAMNPNGSRLMVAGWTQQEDVGGLRFGWTLEVDVATGGKFPNSDSYLTWPGYSVMFNGIAYDSAGGRALVGTRRTANNPNGTDQLVFQVFPASGGYVNQALGAPGASSGVSALAAQGGNGWLLGGNVTLGDGATSRFWLVRVDAAGKVVWDSKVGPYAQMALRDVTAGAADGLLFGGYRIDAGNVAAVFLHTDLAGNLRWSKLVAPPQAQVAGVAAAAGRWWAAGSSTLDSAGFALRTDAFGYASCTACATLTPADCDDANPTTLDLCDPKTGCTHVPVGG